VWAAAYPRRAATPIDTRPSRAQSVKVEGDRLTLGSDSTQLVFTSRKNAAAAVDGNEG
jgi:hypothetical protein